MADQIVTGLALVLVIEGVVYALFPEMMQRAMAIALEMSPSFLRACGLVAAATGVLLVWLLRG